LKRNQSGENWRDIVIKDAKRNEDPISSDKWFENMHSIVGGRREGGTNDPANVARCGSSGIL
jgi:hypothetical protein